MSAAEAVASADGPLFLNRWLDTKAGRLQMQQAADELPLATQPVDQLVTVALHAYRSGRTRCAEQLLDRGRGALRRMPTSMARTAALARLDAAVMLQALDAGEVPDGWFDAVERSLALADTAAGEPAGLPIGNRSAADDATAGGSADPQGARRTAVADADAGTAAHPADGRAWAPDLVADAAHIAFHRTIQLDAPMTPLATDPAGFLQPFRDSSAIRIGLQRSGSHPAARTHFPGYEAVFLSEGNTNFLGPVVRSVEALGKSSQQVSLAAMRDELPWRGHDYVTAVVGGRTGAWDPMMRVLAGNASLVWAEWAQRQALIPSHSLPAGPRLVVRLHAYEIFTALAQFIRWDRVDALVVVSQQMANAARATLPLPDSLPVHVCGIQVEAGAYDDAKPSDARYTLALVGHNSQVKDPAFALDVLDLVRQHEPRARLVLIGAEMTPTHAAQGPAAAAYAHAHLDRLSGYVASGLVTVTGQVAEVGEALRPAGFILSTSRRESFHLGLLEGALSGCVPVVRNWPVMAGFGGPRTFLPDRWVADDAAGMAARVLACMADETKWHAERMRCRDEARAVAAAGDAALEDLLADTLR